MTTKDPTQPEAVQTGTTSTSDGKTTTTPPVAVQTGNTFTQADLDRIIADRLTRERKQWDTERSEIEKRAKMEESERLKAEKADLEKKVAEAQTRATQAERLASLVGKVAAPAAALKLLEPEHLNADGSINVDALLRTFPFLRVTLSGGASGPNPLGAGQLTREQEAQAALARGDMTSYIAWVTKKE